VKDKDLGRFLSRMSLSFHTELVVKKEMMNKTQESIPKKVHTRKCNMQNWKGVKLGWLKAYHLG
jgi:hypothetical protein